MWWAEERKRRLFPAYAGVILAADIRVDGMTAFPRIRGGDPEIDTDRVLASIFSPHTRG